MWAARLRARFGDARAETEEAFIHAPTGVAGGHARHVAERGRRAERVVRELHDDALGVAVSFAARFRLWAGVLDDVHAGRHPGARDRLPADASASAPWLAARLDRSISGEGP